MVTSVSGHSDCSFAPMASHLIGRNVHMACTSASQPSTPPPLRSAATRSRTAHGPDTRTLNDPGAPCRHWAATGRSQDVLLFTYQPFTCHGHMQPASPTSYTSNTATRIHNRDEIPALLRTGLRAVRSYDDHHDLIDADVVAGTDLEATFDRLLGDDHAAYLHVHRATAGCFTCRIDHAPSSVRA